MRGVAKTFEGGMLERVKKKNAGGVAKKTELQIKSFHYRTANEKLSNANENYRMQMKIIQCK